MIGGGATGAVGVATGYAGGAGRFATTAVFMADIPGNVAVVGGAIRFATDMPSLGLLHPLTR
jgi:hypothetical protein